MVYRSCVRSLVVQVGTFTNKLQFYNSVRSLHRVPSIVAGSRNRGFKRSVGMMITTGAVSNSGTIVDMLTEKDDDGGFASGGWKR